MRRVGACLALWLAAAAADLLCPSPRCSPLEASGSKFAVEGSVISITFTRGNLIANCNRARVLDSSALPAFNSAVNVSYATFRNCPPPSRSLAAVLRALNATLDFAETLGNLSLESLPPLPALTASHFAGLERLVGLTLTAASGQPPPSPAPGFLAGLRALRSLVVSGVRLAPTELNSSLPPLRVVHLCNVSWAQLPAAFVNLSSLIELDLNEQRITNISMPPSLRKLSIKYTESAMNDVPNLEHLVLDLWRLPKPLALERCDNLRSLTLLEPSANELPARWVARCPLLERLIIKYANNVSTLPKDLLEGATALKKLTIRQGKLKTLPVGLLTHVPSLRVLDLSRNYHLRTLSSDMFNGPNALAELNLAFNALTSEALHALSGLRHLTVLNLANNLDIADVCDENGDSPLRNLIKLASLSLFGTSVTRICRDWRSNLLLLKTLNLNHSKISVLTFSDITFSRESSSAEVWLRGAPVQAINFTADDFAAALRAPRNGAVLYLDPALACDCRAFWLRLAMEHAPDALRVQGLRCRSGRALKDTAPEDMYCEAAEACRVAALPDACACGRRPRVGGGHVVRANCARAGLREVPRLRAQPATLYHLLLAQNNISELHAEDLGPHLQKLDLSGNFLEVVDDETARALESHPNLQRLRLTLNHLACNCSTAPLRRAMQARFTADLFGLKCHNGTALAALRLERCAQHASPAAWLVGGLLALAALLAAASAAAAGLASREGRLLLRVLLHRWGVLRRSSEPDDARRFDAFVSFSHEDEAVLRELVARLEAGPTPYRLCLHYRDWVPGRWIPEQIRASVSQSRRTLALVSRHFLESEWARAEFREAHAHALRDVSPRLVVVLLEEPAALPLDAELRRYLRAHTYVRWGDPWFWDKLALALPVPRPPAPPPLALVADKVP